MTMNCWLNARLGLVASTRSGETCTDLRSFGSVDVYGAGSRLGATTTANASPGEIVVGRVGSVGSLRLLSNRAWASDNTVILTFDNTRVEPRFGIYILGTLPKYEFVTGTAMPLLTASRLLAQRIRFPLLAQQQAIVDYLEHETPQIDTLVTKQRRLIETLYERRSSFIAHTFAQLSTERLQLRRIIRSLTSGSRDWGDYYADQGNRFLRISNLSRNSLKLRGEVQFVSRPESVTEGERARLRKGDLLFSITAYLGSIAVVDEDWSDAYVSQHVASCRLNAALVEPSFIGWFMLTPEGQNQLKQRAVGGTKEQLALPDLRELQVPLPDLVEQGRIVSCVNDQTAKIDALIAKAEQFIVLARERRSTLITAAVTGQIDVREMS